MKTESNKINWADVWVLRAIRNCTIDGEFDLTEIIAIADFINHSILTSEEFNNAVYRLKQHRLIQQIGEALELTEEACLLFQKHKNKGVHKQGEALEKELNAVGYGPYYNPNALTVPEKFVSESVFKKAVQKYRG